MRGMGQSGFCLLVIHGAVVPNGPGQLLTQDTMCDRAFVRGVWRTVDVDFVQPATGGPLAGVH